MRDKVLLPSFAMLFATDKSWHFRPALTTYRFACSFSPLLKDGLPLTNDRLCLTAWLKIAA